MFRYLTSIFIDKNFKQFKRFDSLLLERNDYKQVNSEHDLCVCLSIKALPKKTLATYRAKISTQVVPKQYEHTLEFYFLCSEEIRIAGFE